MNPIPSQPPPDWQTILRTPIRPQTEPLVLLKPSERIQTLSVYYTLQIDGALPDIWLRARVLERLEAAVHHLPESLGLCVLDGWRPIAVQQALRRSVYQELVTRYPQYTEEQLQAELDQFVAEPSSHPLSPSPHLTGGSVDLTLFDRASGIVLDMGSHFDSPAPESWTAAFETESADATVRTHRRILYHAMRQAGFSNLPTEWWHYDFGNQLWAFYTQQEAACYSVANLVKK